MSDNLIGITAFFAGALFGFYLLWRVLAGLSYFASLIF